MGRLRERLGVWHVMPDFSVAGQSAISVELVDKWLACFDSAGAARKAWAVLRAILRRAIRWNLLDVDITRRDIQLPAKPHYEPRILTIRQQRALLQGFYGHPLEAWLICAVSCWTPHRGRVWAGVGRHRPALRCPARGAWPAMGGRA